MNSEAGAFRRCPPHFLSSRDLAKWRDPKRAVTNRTGVVGEGERTFPSPGVAPVASHRRLDRATRLLLIALIIAGVIARAYDIGYPNGLTWDEHHFVKNARNLLLGRSDWNDHPPLGKLLLAIGLLGLGDNGAGWRLVPMLCGQALIALAYALGASAFDSKLAGLHAAAFVACSGFVLAFSKTALLDGMLAALMVGAALALWRARSLAGFAFAAALIGLSASIKFTGIVLSLPLALLSFRRFGARPKAIGVLCVSLGAMLVPYVAQFSLGLALGGDEWGPLDVWKRTVALLRHHVGLNDWTHSATSRWYTWFVPLKTVDLHYARDGNAVRALSTFDNSILWWSVNAGLVWSLLNVLRGLGKGRPVSADRAAPIGGQGYLLLLWFLGISPWILTNRDSYIYHYLPSYVFGLILLGGLVSTFPNTKARFAFVAIVASVFAYCFRVWSKFPLDSDSLLHRLFFG